MRFSTGRPKADQSPYESIEAKLASCTGLSVLTIGLVGQIRIGAGEETRSIELKVEKDEQLIIFR
jgi:hypothetical protein